MDLRQLRYFIALNEYRSFARAADAMGITQPAFSRSIQGLEQEFGCVLVDVHQSDAVGLGAEEAFVDGFASGELRVLHWRNLPHALDSLNNRCGVISRAGVRLSPAAKALIETLQAVGNPADWPAQTSRNH